MTQRAIEHAALVPARFISLLTRGNPSSVQPSAIRLLVPPKQGKFMELFVVSGGRFLFTQTVDGRIDLWDLGYSAASVINPVPIAFLSEDDQWESSIMALEPTKDETGMYMIVRERSPAAARISIYLVYPLSSNPAFVLFKGPKIFAEGIHYFSASPGVCGIHHGTLFTVWDYLRDLTSTWTVGGENYSLISHGCALLFDVKGIKMWNLPELHPSSDDGPFNPEPSLIPVFSLQYARPSGTLFQKCIPYTSWTRGHDRDIILGVMAHADGGPMLDFYIMEPVPGNNPRLPSAIPLLKASTRICKNDIRVIPAIAGRYCGRYFLQPFTTWEDNFLVNIADPDNLSQNRSVQLYKDDISLAVSQYPNTDLYGFCPMSARLCGLLTGGREIRVMDFVLPK
ncbi:hypothetical protein H0H87_007003 [Tephrocybe sp. NHM501043]|nr:hypothetical protein H0H87_007003 [Tephrocybe sp. NHM501043]